MVNNKGITGRFEPKSRHERQYVSTDTEGRESTSASTMSISLSPPPSPDSKSCINLRRVSNLGKSFQSNSRKGSLTSNQLSIPPQPTSSTSRQTSANCVINEEDDLPFDQKISLLSTPSSKSPSRLPPSPKYLNSQPIKKNSLLVQRPFDETSAFGETASSPPYDETSISVFGESTFVAMGDDNEITVVDSQKTRRDKNTESPRKLQARRPMQGISDLFRSVSPPTKRNHSESKVLSPIQNLNSAKSPVETLSPVDSEASTRFIINSEDLMVNHHAVSLSKLQTSNDHESNRAVGRDSVPSNESGITYFKPPAGSYLKQNDDDDDDQDSLLRSDNEIRKQVSQQPQGSSHPIINKARKIRRNRPTRDLPDDDSSLEAQENDVDVHRSLQHRAQQAYLRRNRFLNNKLSATVPRADATELKSIESTSRSDGEKKSQNQPDLIQSIIPQEEASDVESYGGENETFASRPSIDSHYTKSMESEVEDLFRDLFFVGNGKITTPGRRPVKFKSKSRDSIHCDDDEYTYGSDTYLTEDKTAITDYVHSVSTSTVHDNNKENSVSKQSQSSPQTNQEEGPLNVVLQALEGGVILVAEVLGIYAPCSPSGSSPVPQTKEDKPNVYAPRVAESLSPKQSVVEAVPNIRDTKHSMHSPESSVLIIGNKEELGITLPQALEKPAPYNNFSCLDNTSDSIFGELLLDEIIPQPTARSMTTSPELQSPSESQFTVRDCYPLDQDPRLPDLALYTAQSLHRIHGLPFEAKSHSLELVRQVKFVVIKIGLPLGVLFQENPGGCWVANVFPDGNVAKLKTENALAVGDQLAAVDGRSAIEMGVDDICRLISEAENTQSIELTFVRYVGPLVKQNGQEMQAHDLEDKVACSVLDKENEKIENNELVEEHVFDKMHKMLPISKKESKLKKKVKTEKTKKESSDSESKVRFKWLSRKLGKSLSK